MLAFHLYAVPTSKTFQRHPGPHTPPARLPQPPTHGWRGRAGCGRGSTELARYRKGEATTGTGQTGEAHRRTPLHGAEAGEGTDGQAASVAGQCAGLAGKGPMGTAGTQPQGVEGTTPTHQNQPRAGKQRQHPT